MEPVGYNLFPSNIESPTNFDRHLPDTSTKTATDAKVSSTVQRILCLDFDEVLVSFNFEKKFDRKQLSLEALRTILGVKILTCAESGCNCNQPECGEKLNVDHEIVQHETPGSIFDPESSWAWGTCGLIAHEKFKMIFETIKQEREKDPKSVSLKIITSGPFVKEELRKILNKYYPDTMFKNEGDVEICNKLDLYDGNEDRAFMKILDPRSQLGDHHGVTMSGKRNEIKAEFMRKMLPKWREQQPDLTPREVYLWDDDDAVVLGVNTLGFTGVHFPTNIETRLNNVEFKPDEIFKKMREAVVGTYHLYS